MWRKADPKNLFPLGQVVATLGAIALLEASEGCVSDFLQRHVTGDWGVVCQEDAASNQEALALGNRLMSVYELGGEQLWVITESDRSVTTLLRPEEY